MKILVLNAGSSSHKSCLYAFPDDSLPDDSLPETAPDPLWEALADGSHTAGQVELQVKTHRGAVLQTTLPHSSLAAAIGPMLDTLWQGETQVIDSLAELDAVGHRVVHGGAEYRSSTRITPAVKDRIRHLACFAPIHNPANLAGIEAIESSLQTTLQTSLQTSRSPNLFQEIPQIAVFDTAFHTTLPPTAYTYPGPYDWLDQGIRRYGFHGISHHYCAQRAAQILGQDLRSLRLITCHLGNGCSLAAIRNGQSVDTTMGFTPLEGLMMGTRSGSIDPGILIHLLRQPDFSADRLDHLLNQASGLLGISGVSEDLRLILAAIATGNSRAQLALDLYIHRLRSCIGALVPSLGGLDALVFTAGIGEHSPLIRAEACEPFAFLGLKLNPTQNERSPVDADIAEPDSTVRVLVIHTREEWAIAQQCWQLLRTSQD